MDIWATGGGWAFGMTADNFKYAIGKDHSLTLVENTKAKYRRNIVTVTTNRGTFLETLDADGNVIGEGGDGDWYSIHLSKKLVTLRCKTLPDPKLSPAELKTYRSSVTRYLADDQPHSAGVPDTLTGLIGWAEKLLGKIPKAYRKDARCSFDTSTSYGETYPHVEVSYSEPETDAEVIARVKVERERARLAVIAKKAQLKRLEAEVAAASA